MKTVLKSIACIVFSVTSVIAVAKDVYPSKPIKVIIPFPPGGAVDSFIRNIGPELGAELGQPIVVDNRPGGGGQIGAAAISGAAADGYTIFAGEMGTYIFNTMIYKNISYQPLRDFENVAMLARAPMVMYTSTSGSIKTYAALKEALNAGKNLNYGSFGPGTGPHILGHMLSRLNPASKLMHVPYKGAPPAIQAIMANEIDILFDAVPGMLNMVRNNKGVPLAVAATQRNEFLPNVPTTTELGMPNLKMDMWIGVSVKKGTPPAIVNRLHDAFEKVLAQPAVWKRFSDFGFSRASMSSAQFNTFIESEMTRYRPIISEAGVTVD